MSQAICCQKARSLPCKSSSHGPHHSNSRDCPKFQMESEIQKIRSTDEVSFPEAQCRYQAQYPVNFSPIFVSVLKSSDSATSSFQTIQLNHHSVHCQVTLATFMGDLDRSPQLLKTINPTVKPKAEPQGTEHSSSSA